MQTTLSTKSVLHTFKYIVQPTVVVIAAAWPRKCSFAFPIKDVLRKKFEPNIFQETVYSAKQRNSAWTARRCVTGSLSVTAGMSTTTTAWPWTAPEVGLHAVVLEPTLFI